MERREAQLGERCVRRGAVLIRACLDGAADRPTKSGQPATRYGPVAIAPASSGGAIARPTVGSGRCGAQLRGPFGIVGPSPVQVVQPARSQANLGLAGRRADAGIEAFDRPQER